ncbi:MAG TPA: sensor histidine kinase [Balneolaceae bacterium]|nr:sensor histidine kinase [Balneolaceae bacterium]|tara:strand:+ start:53484 stop:54857 length:1374 start_codon:yes stop_codon:yes gene_type:complete
MNLFAQSGWIKAFLVIFLILLGIGSLVYNRYLVGKVLEKERVSVELWAKALEFNALPVHQEASTMLLEAVNELGKNPTVNDSLIQTLLDVENLRSSYNFVSDELILNDGANVQVPAVLVDANDNPLEYRSIDPDNPDKVIIDYSFKNVPENEIDTKEKRTALIKEFKETNPPIQILIGDKTNRISQYVYYGESPTVKLLRYFPYIQIVILSLLLGIGYTTYRSITRVEQSNLWVGMAKEAAHQLGTPISSLFGWIHLFKDEYEHDNEAMKIIDEIENDVQRLSGVAERFGKIGSEAELKATAIEPILNEAVNYMERRLPKIGKPVVVKKEINADAMVNINQELFQWAVENLVKNAMDAMRNSDKPEMFIAVKASVHGNDVLIDIQDSGSGIDPRNVNTVFKPGFSTKKRGWGLGLSLTKRIIEDYHKGNLFVYETELNVGTTMRIRLDKIENRERIV